MLKSGFLLISQHPCGNGVPARVRKSNAGQGKGKQDRRRVTGKNRYVIKVMNSHREGGQGCPKPFNWSIIITTVYYSDL